LRINVNSEKPLTLALSQRERGLTELFFSSYADLKDQVEHTFKNATIGSLSLGRGLG